MGMSRSITYAAFLVRVTMCYASTRRYPKCTLICPIHAVCIVSDIVLMIISKIPDGRWGGFMLDVVSSWSTCSIMQSANHMSCRLELTSSNLRRNATDIIVAATPSMKNIQ